MRTSLRVATIVLGALGLLSSIRSLHADPTARDSTSDYRSVYRGIIVGSGFEMGSYGEAVPGSAGAETAGVRSLEHRQLLLTWDAAGGVTGGYGGNESPGFGFVGGRVDLSGELGYRFERERTFSPYAGAGAEFAFSAVDVPSAPAGGPNAANNLDGLAGETGRFATRCNIGGSYLSDRHSLELTAFAQEALRPKGSWAATSLYYEVGIHAQYDLSQRLSLLAEALYGVTAKKSERAFGSTTEGRHEEAVLVARKMFGKGFWVALEGSVAENGNVTTYAGSPITYSTSGPPSLAAALTLGIPIE
jgi:hypothetical protein